MVRSGQVRSGQVRSGQVRSGQQCSVPLLTVSGPDTPLRAFFVLPEGGNVGFVALPFHIGDVQSFLHDFSGAKVDVMALVWCRQHLEHQGPTSPAARLTDAAGVDDGKIACVVTHDLLGGG